MFQLSTSRRRNPAVSLLLLLLTCTSVSAVPLSNYHQNIKRAIETLEALTKIDEDEADVNDIENQFVESSRSVRSILPQHQTVEFDGDSYNVDNSWLHKSLDELDRSADRSDKLEQILDSLRALEARVAERQNPGRLAESKEQAKGRLENILNRPEYATGKHGANALARLLQDIANWLEKLLPKRNISVSRVNFISVIARIVVLAIAALVIAYVLKIVLSWFVGHSSRPKRRKIKEPRIVLGEKLEPDATATDLLAEAEALARQGDLRAAIRKAYIALLVELGDRKLISLAHHKTNRDYLNSLRTQPQIHSRMRGLTDSFERHWYGFVAATPNDWQDFRAGYLSTLEGETN
jgi:CHASE3 domain sensor protein